MVKFIEYQQNAESRFLIYEEEQRKSDRQHDGNDIYDVPDTDATSLSDTHVLSSCSSTLSIPAGCR